MKYMEVYNTKNGVTSRTCGCKKMNNQYLPQFVQYIKTKCPWCGGDGEYHENGNGQIFVRCSVCKAYNPNGKTNLNRHFYPKDTDFDALYDKLCKKAAKLWAVRKDDD